MKQAPRVPVGATELVDVGGRRLNAWRAGGAGPVVLLVHGIPTNHLLWHDVVPALVEHVQVVAVDLLGYGWSDDPGGWPVDIASQAGYLLRLLDALGLDRVVVVGHDLGGGVAQILAVTAPERVAAVAVVDGVCFDGWPVPLVRAMKWAWPLLRWTPPAALPAVLAPALRTLFASSGSASAFLPRFVLPWSAAGGTRRLTLHLRALDSVYTQSVAPFLSRLRMPVEVVWGRLDHQMQPRWGERLAAAVPTARLTWVGGASHFVPADAPDAVVAAVHRLLARG